MFIKSSPEGTLEEKEGVDIRTWISATGKDYSRHKGFREPDRTDRDIPISSNLWIQVARPVSLENTNHFCPLHSALAQVTDLYTEPGSKLPVLSEPHLQFPKKSDF